MQPDMLEGARLFNRGAYWEAHEAWEQAWNAAKARADTIEVAYVQGLILLAAALHKGHHDQNAFGAKRNYQKALRRLEGIEARAALDGIDLPGLCALVHSALLDSSLQPQLPL